MSNQTQRGSEKLLAAWKTRVLTEESVKDIAKTLDKSPAKVEDAQFSGGLNATGLRLSLSYDGDDTPYCGNDLKSLLDWALKYRHQLVIPRILINGVQPIDRVLMEIGIGDAAEGRVSVPKGLGEGPFAH